MAIVTSATCGSCGRTVPTFAKLGGHCPSCGALFGEVREHRTEIRVGVDWKRVGQILAGGMVLALLIVPVMLLAGRSAAKRHSQPMAPTPPPRPLALASIPQPSGPALAARVTMASGETLHVTDIRLEERLLEPGAAGALTREIVRLDYSFIARGVEAKDSVPFDRARTIVFPDAPSGFEVRTADGARITCDLRARTLVLVAAGGRTDRFGCPFPSLAAALRSGPDDQGRRWEAAALAGETPVGSWRSPIADIRRIEFER